MKAIVIGSGIGGLFSAGVLSEKGYDVVIYEKLAFPGGRFTNLEYRGFQLTTGALHMIPHGSRGPFAGMLRKLGADVEIVDSAPEATALYNGEVYEVVSDSFPILTVMKFAWEVFKEKIFRKEKSLWDMVSGFDPFTKKFTRAFCGWSLSILPEDMPFSRMKKIYDMVRRYRGPGIPIGGCRAVIDSLIEVLESNGVKIFLKHPVERIITDGSIVRGVEVKGERIESDVVVSDIGHSLTAGLTQSEDYMSWVENLIPSRGIKISVAVKEPFVGHTGVMFTLDTERISGMNEVTQADENLAPGGYHLVMTHQPVITSNVRYEINLGLKDLKKLMGDREYEILAIQSYSGDWPVNRVSAGRDVGFRTPFENLVVVGDGAKEDGIEVEGIALGVERAMEEL